MSDGTLPDSVALLLQRLRGEIMALEGVATSLALSKREVLVSECARSIALEALEELPADAPSFSAPVMRERHVGKYLVRVEVRKVRT